MPHYAAAMVSFCGRDDALNSEIDGVILVIGSQLFNGLQGNDFGFGVYGLDFFKDGEVADQVEQGAFVEHPLSQDFKLVSIKAVGVGVVVDVAVGEFAFPLAKAAQGGREGACTGGGAIGNHQQGVVGKEAGDFAFVGL